MLVKLLSGKSFFIQILLGILFFGLFFAKSYTTGRLYEDVWGIVAFCIIVVVAYLFFLTSKLFKSPGLPFCFFIIPAFVFSGITEEPEICISLLICNVLFWRMVHGEEKSDSKTYAFDVGIGLSLSFLFYPPSVFIIGLILFNYLYMQSLNLRIVLLFVLGFILPMAIGLQILYLSDNMDSLDQAKQHFCLDLWNNSTIIPLLPIALMIIAAWLDHLSHSGTQDINKRHIYFLFFLYFINWLAILILFGGNNSNFLIVLIFPVSMFLGRFIQYLRSIVWKEIILWGYLLVMAGFYFREEILKIYNDLLGNVAF